MAPPAHLSNRPQRREQQRRKRKSRQKAEKTAREKAEARACGRTPLQEKMLPGEEVGTHLRNPLQGSSATLGGGWLCPTNIFVRHRGCHARRSVRSSHTHVRGLAGLAHSSDIAL